MSLHVFESIVMRGRLRFATDKIKAVIRSNPLDGEDFQSADGKEFLAEAPGTRSVTPITLVGPTPVNAFKTMQSFVLRPGEGVYGLGQHQDGLMDYRGNVVELEQQNREIAIPFAITSRGVNVLWNSPSHTSVNASQCRYLTCR